MSPSQFLRRGARPTACQPMWPSTSAQTMFSEGVRNERHASRNSAQLVAWSSRRLARYGAVPSSSQAARKA